jgi:two-component system response regulator AtoC
MHTILLGGRGGDRTAVRAALESGGFRVVEEAASPGAGSNSGAGCALALLFLDGLDAGDLRELERLRSSRPHTPIVIVAAEASGEAIARALKAGAANVFHTRIEPGELVRLAAGLLPDAAPDPPGAGAWGRKLDLLLDRVGKSDVPVLLYGETGAGKEVLARKLHARSPRAGKPFLKLNCAALPSELVESELFGYEKGAFTGAFKTTLGKFELAHEGTILLDEIGDMDFRLQAKLLQVVQDHEFLRLGAKETSRVDVRVMAATHCDLEAAMAEGRFREDLYYRLNIIQIHIPPLRDRRDEILPLASHFLQLHGTGELAPPLTPELERSLLDYSWPGNVRELENVIRRYLVTRDATSIMEDLQRRRETVAPKPPQRNPSPSPSRLLGPLPEAGTLEAVDSAHRAAETAVIERALETAQWNRKRAAALLGIDYKALLYRMKKLGIGKREGTEEDE